MAVLKIYHPESDHRHLEILSRGDTVRVRSLYGNEGKCTYVGREEAKKVIAFLQKELNISATGCIDE